MSQEPVSSPFAVPSHIQEHQDLRRKAKRMRSILRMQINKPIEEQCKFLLEHGITVQEIAAASELREGDVQALANGTCYPYIRNQWIRYFHEPDDHATREPVRRTKWNR